MPGAGGGKNGELLLNGYSISLWENEKVLEMDGGYTQCECTHATELYILKIKPKTGSAGEDMEKSSHILGGDTKWCSCYGQQYGGPSKIKNRTIM